MRTVVALYGPTSSGKTALSIRLCELFAERAGLRPFVISADSRQVYRYMDIGTSKTTAGEMRGVPHFMIDVTEPSQKLELEDYVTAARGHMRRLLDEGDGIAVIVGGTGTYVRALLEGWDVEGVGELRDQLRRDFPPALAADAHATLRRLDPQRAAGVHPHNHAGVINALARVMAGGSDDAAGEVRHVVLGVDRPARELDRRIADTFRRQLHDGLAEEVLGLDERYGLSEQFARDAGSSRNQVLHTHGYTEWFEHARATGRDLRSFGDDDLEAVSAAVVDRITTHARRQRTVFAKLPEVRMVRNADEAFRLATSVRSDPRSVGPGSRVRPQGSGARRRSGSAGGHRPRRGGSRRRRG